MLTEGDFLEFDEVDRGDDHLGCVFGKKGNRDHSSLNLFSYKKTRETCFRHHSSRVQQIRSIFGLYLLLLFPIVVFSGEAATTTTTN